MKSKGFFVPVLLRFAAMHVEDDPETRGLLRGQGANRRTC
mgnify:CR=1 FL=1